MADPYQFPPPTESQSNSAKTGMLLIGGVFACIGIMIALLVAYVLAFQRPAQARIDNATATAAAMSTSTAISRIRPPNDWDLIVEDDFEDQDNPLGWHIGEKSGEQGTWAGSIASGRLHWELSPDLSQIIFDQPDRIGQREDFYISIEGNEIQGPDYRGSYGFSLWQTDDSFYFFSVSEDGQFYIGESTDDGWEDIILWKDGPIYADHPNHLALFVRGTHFIFIVNDTVAAELDREDYEGAYVLLAAVPYDKNDVTTVEWDELRFYAPAD